MTRAGARSLFAIGLVLASGVLAIAAFTALTPKPVPIAASRDVALASFARLARDVPALVTSRELAPLEGRAWELRAAAARFRPIGPRVVDELPIYLLRTDGEVRAFIGIDPRNGCRLEVMPVRTGTYSPSITAFHDVCHGSLYDLNGTHIGGPSPWALDELVVSVRGGLVYADLREVKPGRLGLP